MPATLPWGRHYLAVDPGHFRVDYRINPFMDPADQPHPVLAAEQWQTLLGTLRGLGARVEVLESRPEVPDLVYAMNLGLAVATAAGRRRVLLSHMRHPQRRPETPTARDWFTRHGYATRVLGPDGTGAHFEAGDAFPFGDGLLVGHGPRTEVSAAGMLAAALGTRVYPLRIVHPAMYHLDLAFCPLGADRAIVCPDAFDRDSAEALLALVREPLVVSEDEALATFCANSVVVGATVVMPACPTRVRRRLEDWGYTVVVVDVSEFHKGGGSVRCLTNPLDLRMGRDLPSIPGGEVCWPAALLAAGATADAPTSLAG